MRPCSLYASLVLTTMLFGCGGVSFSPVPITRDIPESFKNRNVYPDQSGILKYKLDQILGNVIYQEPNANSYDLKGVILKKGYKPLLELVKDEAGHVFEGTVNQSVGVKGSYLTFAASLDIKEIATFSIRDRFVVFVDNNDVPWEALIKEAKLPKANSATRRFWIQGALLSSLDAVRLSEISSNASAVVGPAIGAEGKVYSKYGQEIHDYRISFHFIDLDKLAEKPQAKIASMLMAPQSIDVKEFQVEGMTLLRFRETDFK